MALLEGFTLQDDNLPVASVYLGSYLAFALQFNLR